MLRIRHAVVGLCLVIALGIAAIAQNVRYEIPFPSLDAEHQTLVCDFHMHTVFSDGSVWPPVRIDEAWRLGLHALSITDHIEYQPHKDDVPTKHERPYELAFGAARTHNLILIKGAEITRDTPPGHFNAIFLTDIAALDHPDLMEVMRRANEQGAFVFWNHPGWKGPELGRWGDVQQSLFEKGWLHGIEIANGDTYYLEGHQYAMEKNLTLIGNSDIHRPDLDDRTTPERHRTMTLVFAKERTAEGIKEALQNRRTAVWFGNQLIARREILEPFFYRCLVVEPPHVRGRDVVWAIFRNQSYVDIVLERTGPVGPASIVVPAQGAVVVRIGTPQPKAALELVYKVVNFIIEPNVSLPVTLTLPGAQ